MSDDRPTRDVIAELLTTEAKLAALGAHGAHLRHVLQERAETELREQGTAPTWRAAGLGLVTLPVRKPSVSVRDADAFASWAAQRHTDHVTARITLDCSPSQLADMVDVITVFHEDAGWPEPRTSLHVDPKWLAGFLEQVTVVLDADGDGFFAPDTGETVDGLVFHEGGPSSVSVRLDPEAKRRAAAEVTTADSAQQLLAPLGVTA